MELNLRLATPSGDVFCGPVSEVSLRTSQGIVQLSPGNPTYLGRILAGRIDFRIGSEWLGYAIFDASASTDAGALTVIAVQVSQLESSGQAHKRRRILHE
jgi:F0F1-type ATP synthase epsilon subunit